MTPFDLIPAFGFLTIAYAFAVTVLTVIDPKELGKENTMKLFRDLKPGSEEESFRVWARENYKPFTEIKGIWHPVVQDECVKINKEQGRDVNFCGSWHNGKCDCK